MAHPHYCTIHGDYWEHGDDLCANLGRSMMCPECFARLAEGANDRPRPPVMPRRDDSPADAAR